MNNSGFSFIIVFLFAFLLFIFGCDTTRFDEYPPSTFLSDAEQSRIVINFIAETSNRDSTTVAQLDVLPNFQLRYYFEAEAKKYYMISLKASPVSTGIECYLGDLDWQRDTVFRTLYAIEVTTDNAEDSVKTLYKKMILSKR